MRQTCDFNHDRQPRSQVHLINGAHKLHQNIQLLTHSLQMLISTATMPVYNNSNNNDRVFWAHLENAMRLHYYRGKNKLVKTY